MSPRHTIAILAALFCLAAAADPAERLADPAKEARARALFQDIRCVVCQNESIDDSEADLAADLRKFVRHDISAGATDAQIRATLVRRYGEFILLKPPFNPANAALWLAPFLIVLGGGLVFWVRSRRIMKPNPSGDLTAEEERRLKALDAD
jgi:cytochrome c-type biogenesis protein CcmH